MSWKKDIVSSISRPIYHPITGYAGFDPDASAYFTAVETAGGSFDLTGIDPTYTESYVKTAHSNFYAGLKTDGVWDKLTEFYLLAGKTFGGLTVKGKGTGSLTNNNFVTGDWLGAGSGAGLTGDGSTKYLDTGLLDSSLSANNRSFSAYSTNAGVTAGIVDTSGGYILRWNASVQDVYFPQTIGDFNASAYYNIGNPSSLHIFSHRGLNDSEFYENGTSVASDSASVSDITPPTLTWYLLAKNNNGGAQFGDSATLTFAHVGTGLTDTEASNLSTRVNTLMTALGCNTY